MIISIVLLAFLTSLAVQVPQIPAVSKGYPLVLLIVSYLMTFYLLISSVVKLKSEDKQKTQVIEQAKIIVPYCLMIVVYRASRSAAFHPKAVRGHFGNPALASR